MANIFADFLIKEGLYQEIKITKDNFSDLLFLVGGNVRISTYCKECGETRVFSMAPISFPFNLGSELHMQPLAEQLKHFYDLNAMCRISTPGKLQPDEQWIWTNRCIEYATRVITFQFSCSMHDEHHLDFIVLTDDEKMKKIGQYPSVADLTFPELDDYRKVISKEERGELRRAIGLHAQGIGAGSYVYLRRIFEQIINNAKDSAVADGAIVEKDFISLRMNEKIKALKAYLPEILNSNPTFYGIVSKGIHELSEEDCIAYFPVMKDCIFMILQQWEEKRRKEDAEKQLTASLSKITNNIT